MQPCGLDLIAQTTNEQLHFHNRHLEGNEQNLTKSSYVSPLQVLANLMPMCCGMPVHLRWVSSQRSAAAYRCNVPRSGGVKWKGVII